MALLDNVDQYENLWYGASEGKIWITPSTAARSTFIQMDDKEIFMSSQKGQAGISITDSGVSIQGVANFTSHGDSIIKGKYSENPKGAKVYTYRETVYFESQAKEEAYKQMGENAGINVAEYDVGGMPIITDIASGPLPHTHTISMKHVHRLEPNYIYRLPGFIRMFKDFASSWSDFLGA